MLSDDDIIAQVLAAFQAEQAEHRQKIADLLLDWERDPNPPDRRARLDQLFRAAHSLKGGARAAGQLAVEEIAHRLEDVFSAVRTGTVVLTPQACDPLYVALDAIGALMHSVANGQEPNLAPYADVLATLDNLALGNEASSAPVAALATLPEPPAAALATTPSETLAAPSEDQAQAAPPTSDSQSVPLLSAEPSEESSIVISDQSEVADQTIRIATTTLDTLLNETGELITCNVRLQQRAREARGFGDSVQRWQRTWQQVQPTYAKLHGRGPSLQPTVHYLEDRPSFANLEFEASDRDTEQLLSALAEANRLIRTFEQRLGQHAIDLAEDSARLQSVTERIHDQVRRTRMLPIASIWSQMRLQVREMARLAGKQVTLELDDGGAEADRQVLEQLREVLLHLLRNAVDHGIESSTIRAGYGKPAAGMISLRAVVSGDRLIVTLADDGAGLNLAAIRQRALASGIGSATELERWGEAELADLIFLPGFSTRQTVSTLSGRGVGLDIVRVQVERMHGRVEIHSTPHQGCVFTLSLPLSLTSTHGLVFQVGTATYTLPLDAIERIIAVEPNMVQIVEDRAALALNGRPVILVRLADLLGLPSGNSANRLHGLALILGTGDRQVACLVDAILGEHELVQHRLPMPLQQIRFVAGATILPDGEIAPILDVVDVLRAIVGSRTIGLQVPVAPSAPRSPKVLIVDDSITTRTLEKNILTTAGYTVLLAADGEEAFQMLLQETEQGGVDLLLSDVDMPRLNGFDLTKRVRAHSTLQHLPVVLVTSLDGQHDRERGIAAGADAYIVKRGFDQHVLLDTISQLI